MTLDELILKKRLTPGNQPYTAILKVELVGCGSAALPAHEQQCLWRRRQVKDVILEAHPSEFLMWKRAEVSR